jgi:hypothetical protein
MEPTDLVSAPVGVTAGDAWPPQELGISFTWEEGREYSMSVPACATFSFVRAAICQQLQLAFDQISLYSSQDKSAVDMTERVTETKLIVETRVIDITFRGIDEPIFVTLKNTPLSCRIVDVRQRLSEAINKEFSRVALVMGGQVLRDVNYISEYGLVNRICVESGFCRSRFGGSTSRTPRGGSAHARSTGGRTQRWGTSR